MSFWVVVIKMSLNEDISDWKFDRSLAVLASLIKLLVLPFWLNSDSNSINEESKYILFSISTTITLHWQLFKWRLTAINFIEVLSRRNESQYFFLILATTDDRLWCRYENNLVERRWGGGECVCMSMCVCVWEIGCVCVSSYISCCTAFISSFLRFTNLCALRSLSRVSFRLSICHNIVRIRIFYDCLSSFPSVYLSVCPSKWASVLSAFTGNVF
jgi:hypothetical protein